MILHKGQRQTVVADCSENPGQAAVSRLQMQRSIDTLGPVSKIHTQNLVQTRTVELMALWSPFQMPGK